MGNLYLKKVILLMRNTDRSFRMKVPDSCYSPSYLFYYLSVDLSCLPKIILKILKYRKA